jgi:predicted nucleotidyltransferase
MSTAILKNQVKTKLEELLSNQIEFAYLLGSATTDRFNAESDIDLGVYWKEVPDFTHLNEMTASLESHFSRDVDLVSLNTTDLIFSRQVLETGCLLICQSPGIHLQWKADQLSRYPDFKYSRKVIEQNILNRKKYV